MSEWVGLQPLRVQALMTKLQAEKTKLSDLEGRVWSIQNNLSWEITSKGDVADALQRARNKIRRRGELLTELEGVLRGAVDSFDATDKKRTDSKNALSYWSAVSGAGALVTGLTSLAMSCGDSLFKKVGNMFGTGTGGALASSIFTMNGIPLNVFKPDSPTAGSILQSTMSSFPQETVLGTPAPFQENEKYEKLLLRNSSIVKLSKEEQAELIEYAKAKGLSGERPNAALMLTNSEAFDAQYKAWKSTFTEEEWAEYQSQRAAEKAAREAEKEADKSLFEKAYYKLGSAGGGVTKAVKNVAKKAEKKIDAAGEWIEDKAEWAGDKLQDGVGWVGDKAEDVGEWVGKKVEDGKEWVNDVTGEVNDFIEEHPGLKYSLGAAGSTLEFAGGVLSFAGKATTMATNPVAALAAGSEFYDTTVNKFFNMAQDDVALFNYGVGKILESVGTSKAKKNAADLYADAQRYSEMDGMAGMLQSEGCDNMAVVVEVLDTTANTTGAIAGAASFVEKLGEKQIFEAIFNWKELKSGDTVMEKIGYYDDLISNISTGTGVVGGILEKDGSAVISTIISPVKLWGKFDSFFSQSSE